MRGKQAMEWFLDGWIQQRSLFLVFVFANALTCTVLCDGVRTPDCLQRCGGGVSILARETHAVDSVRRFSPLSGSVCVNVSVGARAHVFSSSSSSSSSSAPPTFSSSTSHWYLLLQTADGSSDEFEHRSIAAFFFFFSFFLNLASMDCLCIVTTKVRDNSGSQSGWGGDMDWDRERMSTVREWGMDRSRRKEAVCWLFMNVCMCMHAFVSAHGPGGCLHLVTFKQSQYFPCCCWMCSVQMSSALLCLERVSFSLCLYVCERMIHLLPLTTTYLNGAQLTVCCDVVAEVELPSAHSWL